MRKLFIGLFVLVVVLIAAIAIIPSLVPSEIYKEKIQTQLTKELARDVTIEGDVKVSVFPSIRAKTDRVTIANPDGFEGDVFASMDALNAKVKLLPLLSKRVEISAFELKNPVINLQKKADGSANWVMGTPAQTAPTSKEDAGPFKRDGRFAAIDPAIGRFAIENGAISYSDATTGAVYDLKDANLAFALPSLSKPVEVKGDVLFGGEPVTLDVTLDTPRKFLDGEAAPVTLALETAFAAITAKGEFLASEDIAFDLNVDGDIKDMAAVAAYVPSELPLAALAETVNLQGNYRFDGTVLSAKGADISANGPALDAAYKGDAVLGETPVLNGAVDLDVRDIPLLAGLLKQDITGLDLAKTLTLTADLAAEGTGFKAQNVKANLAGEGLNAGFNGTAAFADSVSASGDFTANAASIPALVKALKVDMPQAAALGSADVKGRLSMAGESIKLTNLSAVTDGGTAQGRYDGEVTLGKEIGINGTFDAALASLSEFAAAAGTEVPYSGAIGMITAKGTVSGQGKTLTISGLDAQLTDGEINGRYEGSASMAEGFNLDGKLDADIKSLRKLAAMSGTDLPPSTSTGAIYENMSVTGTVKGSPSDISFKDAALTFDQLSGTGDFDVDLKGAKPFVRGTLNLAGLDLRPYMASYTAQNPTGEIQPWSEQPLNVAMLRAVDGDFKINTPDMITDRLTMGAANVDATLRSGKLTARIPKLNMYGGLGNATAVLDAAGSIPTVALDMSMNDLQTNKFLAAVAGFTNATGEGQSGVSIRGSGRSQAEIMKSLTGQGDFKIENGKISGVDLQQLLTDLDTALASRSLPSGIGTQYVTEFNRIRGLFKIENGIARVNDFDLGALGVAAKGGGSIDLGNQNIDFSLQPRLTGKSASDLASFGIPIRIQGGFGGVKAGLDTDMLGQIVAAQAKARLQKELTDKVGGQAGSIIGGILGGQTGSQSTGQGTTAPKPEDAVTDLLGGLLGSQTKPAQTDPSQKTEEQKKKEEEAKKKKEPSIEDALLGILGSKD